MIKSLCSSYQKVKQTIVATKPKSFKLLLPPTTNIVEADGLDEMDEMGESDELDELDESDELDELDEFESTIVSLPLLLLISCLSFIIPII